MIILMNFFFKLRDCFTHSASFITCKKKEYLCVLVIIIFNIIIIFIFLKFEICCFLLFFFLYKIVTEYLKKIIIIRNHFLYIPFRWWIVCLNPFCSNNYLTPLTLFTHILKGWKLLVQNTREMSRDVWKFKKQSRSIGQFDRLGSQVLQNEATEHQTVCVCSHTYELHPTRSSCLPFIEIEYKSCN